MIRRWTLALACAASLLAPASQAAQAYPNHPVSIVVPVAAGGSMDIAGRALAQHLKDVLGQPVIIENKPGGSGNIAYGHVARAKPDGYTLLFSYEGFHAGNPALAGNLPWDPVKSFTPIAEITRGPHVITVPKPCPPRTCANSSPWRKSPTPISITAPPAPAPSSTWAPSSSNC